MKTRTVIAISGAVVLIFLVLVFLGLALVAGLQHFLAD